MIRTKGANQSAQFQTLNCLREISTILYFDKFHLLKVYKISTKKVQRVMFLLDLRVVRNLKKN